MRLVSYRHRWALVHYDAEGKRKRIVVWGDDREENRPLAEREARRVLRERARPVEQTCGAIYAAYLADTAALSKTRMDDAWKALRGAFAPLAPKDVTREVCRSYAKQRRAAGRKDSTIRSELIYLRAALRWADRNTPAQIEMPPPAPPVDRHLSRAEFDKLVAAAADTFHLKLFIHLALATAARKEALLSMSWTQVNWQAGTIWLGEKVSGKRRATVPMTESLAALMREAHRIRTKDCPTVIEFAGGPVRSIRTSFERAAARAGLPWLTPHVLRHTAAVWMAEAGNTMGEIAQYLGHSDSRITERVYARYSPGHLRKLAAALEVGETVHGGSAEPADREQGANRRTKSAKRLTVVHAKSTP
jgi:integrase